MDAIYKLTRRALPALVYALQLAWATLSVYLIFVLLMGGIDL